MEKWCVQQKSQSRKAAKNPARHGTIRREKRKQTYVTRRNVERDKVKARIWSSRLSWVGRRAWDRSYAGLTVGCGLLAHTGSRRLFRRHCFIPYLNIGITEEGPELRLTINFNAKQARKERMLGPNIKRGVKAARLRLRLRHDDPRDMRWRPRPLSRDYTPAKSVSESPLKILLYSFLITSTHTFSL